MVDPEESSREAVRELVATMNLRCACFARGQEFLDRFAPSQHGCVILAVRIPDINGLEIQSRLAALPAPIPVVFLAEHGTISIAVRAMRAGALNFLEKPFREHELWDAIEEALALDQRRRGARTCQEHIEKQLASLTEREREVLGLFAAGTSKKGIATGMGICLRTVEVRLRQIMKKVGVNSRPELMRLAVLAGEGQTGGACPRGSWRADDLTAAG